MESQPTPRVEAFDLPSADRAVVVGLLLDSRGALWFQEGQSLPRRYPGGWPDFIYDSARSRGCTVRLPLTAEHSTLALALQLLSSRGGLSGVQVCNPLLVRPYDDPSQVLLRMRQLQLVGSQGGWFSLNRDGGVILALSEVFRLASMPIGRLDRSHCELLTAHPVWRPLSFIPSLSVERAGALLAAVIDPRLYIDPHDPDRTHKLEIYLGVTPEGIAGADKRQAGLGSAVERCRLVRDCWLVPPRCPDEASAPRYFLWRAYLQAGGAARAARAELRASQRLVRFLRGVWLDACSQRPQGSESLFQPEHFFSSADEVLAFRAHVKACA
jgi:hypothetical protein